MSSLVDVDQLSAARHDTDNRGQRLSDVASQRPGEDQRGGGRQCHRQPDVTGMNISIGE